MQLKKIKNKKSLVKFPADTPRGEVIIYKAKDGQTRLDVKLNKETVWLSLDQMATLFDRDKSVISRHIRNIFNDRELSRNSVVAKFATTAADGKVYQVDYYSLDVVISVGYRVQSLRGVQFRIWATQILKKHLVNGYTLDQKRLAEQAEKLLELQRAVKLIQEKSQSLLLQDQAQELLQIISDYSQSLNLLHQYDEGKLEVQKNKKPSFIITYSDCQRIIRELKRKVLERKEAGNLFGMEAGEKFQAIIGALYQAFDGKELYFSLEEKAAHLFYLAIKDHPFVDGNKRIASILFVYFLECNDYLRRENGERKINDNTLVALALLIATSQAMEKDIIIRIITNLLK